MLNQACTFCEKGIATQVTIQLGKKNVRQAKLGETSLFVADQRNLPQERCINPGMAGGDERHEARVRKCAGRNALSGVKVSSPVNCLECGGRGVMKSRRLHWCRK